MFFVTNILWALAPEYKRFLFYFIFILLLFLEGLSTGAKNPTGKGSRLIVVHIGNENGFWTIVNGSLSVKRLVTITKPWMPFILKNSLRKH